MLQLIAAVLSLATVAMASFAGNLNYGSPSHHHPALGVSIRKVAARNTPSAAWNPSQLTFTHGVTGSDPYDNSIILWTRAAPMSDNDESNVTVTGAVPLYNHQTEVYVEASKAQSVWITRFQRTRPRRTALAKVLLIRPPILITPSKSRPRISKHARNIVTCNYC